MPSNAIQKTVAFDRETAFADPDGDGTAKDWDSLTANGAVINCRNLDYSKIKRPKIPNGNLVQRAGAMQAGVLGLRGHEFSFDTDWSEGSANAAEAAQAARIAQDELLYNALGGEHRGYAAGLAAGTAGSPTVEDAHGDNLVPYGWSFFVDATTGYGEFACYSAVTEGVGSDTLTMAPGHTLSFTPDAGGADVAHAVVAHYPDWDALEDYTHTNHTSLCFFFKGRHAEHSVESLGDALSVEMGPIEQGTPGELKWSGMGCTFRDNGISQPTLDDTPAGGPGSVIGSGIATLCHFATAGSALASQTFWGAAQVTFGIKKDPVTGPNGREGKHGFGLTEDSYAATKVEITVPFDDALIAEYHAETRKHLRIQIGRTVGDARFVYFPNLEYADTPEKVSVGGRDALKLTFNAHERDVAQGSMTAAQYHLARAKVIIGRVG